jgi:hypothetical protein
MSVDGTWRLAARTPVGDTVSTLRVSVRGGDMDGTQTILSETVPVKDGMAEGDRVAWTIDLQAPFPLTLLFRARVEGDRLTGVARSSRTGEMTFTGERVRDEEAVG